MEQGAIVFQQGSRGDDGAAVGDTALHLEGTSVGKVKRGSILDRAAWQGEFSVKYTRSSHSAGRKTSRSGDRGRSLTESRNPRRRGRMFWNVGLAPVPRSLGEERRERVKSFSIVG